MDSDTQFNDEVLMLYADGALDEKTSAMLEVAMVGDSELRERIKLFITAKIYLTESQELEPVEIPSHIRSAITKIEQEKKPKKEQEHTTARSWLGLIAAFISSIFHSSKGESPRHLHGTPQPDGSVSLIGFRKISISMPILIAGIGLAGGVYFYSVIEGLNLKLQQGSSIESSSFVTSNSIALESQLEDLNSQYIVTIGELQSLQQKLILATSKSQVLEDEVASMQDVRPVLYSLETQLAATEEVLITVGRVAQVSQEKYDALANELVVANLHFAVRNMNRIVELKETTAAVSLATAVAPAIGVAKLIDYTFEEIQNYCADIEWIIRIEQKAVGEVRSIIGAVKERFESQCR